MKRMRKICLVFVTGMVCILGGCGKEEASSADLSSQLKQLGQIVPVTRETGSGTRSSFAQALGIHVKGEDDRDTILDAAQKENTGEKVIKAVENDQSAIGYVTYGTSLPEDGQVKEISVNGSDAEDASIENGSYPLARTLYLAEKEDGNALKEDFLVYVTGKGQEIVKDFFVPANDAKEVFISRKPSGTLRIHGSTTLAPAMEKLASAYEKENPNASIQVEISDSSTGITDTLTGKSDMAMISRNLYDYEKTTLTAVPVAKDGIRVIVNRKNPLDDISVKMLADIYTGEKTQWKDTEE